MQLPNTVPDATNALNQPWMKTQGNEGDNNSQGEKRNIVLDRDVAQVFQTSDSVNQALRYLMQTAHSLAGFK